MPKQSVQQSYLPEGVVLLETGTRASVDLGDGKRYLSHAGIRESSPIEMASVMPENVHACIIWHRISDPNNTDRNFSPIDTVEELERLPPSVKLQIHWYHLGRPHTSR